MIDIWFGLDATAFEKAREWTVGACAVAYSLVAEFDKTFGPILLVTYACLSNTLLLTGASALSDKSLFTNAQVVIAVLVSVRLPLWHLGMICDAIMVDPLSYILHDFRGCSRGGWFHALHVFLYPLRL
jgi:hypothetical protein